MGFDSLNLDHCAEQSAPSESEGADFYVGKRFPLCATNNQKNACKRPDVCWFLPMITYDKVFKNPQVANGLIGMSLAEFEKLYAEFELTHIGRVNAIQYTQRHQVRRRRAVGAGRKHKYSLHDRLLMTLFWLRAYTTYKVLGIFYGLDKTTVEDYLKNVISTLSTMDSFNFERPLAEVPRLRSVQEVINAFPDILLIIDSEENSVRRPQKNNSFC